MEAKHKQNISKNQANSNKDHNEQSNSELDGAEVGEITPKNTEKTNKNSVLEERKEPKEKEFSPIPLLIEKENKKTSG